MSEKVKRLTVAEADFKWSDRHWWLAGWGDMDMEIMG